MSFFKDFPVFTAVFMVVLAALMVSHLPTFSGKLLGAKIKPVYAMPITVVGVMLAAILMTYPYVTLSLFCFLYMLLIPFGLKAYATDLGKHSGGEKLADDALDVVENDQDENLPLH